MGQDLKGGKEGRKAGWGKWGLVEGYLGDGGSILMSGLILVATSGLALAGMSYYESGLFLSKFTSCTGPLLHTSVFLSDSLAML
jgi:hypothetical protein